MFGALPAEVFGAGLVFSRVGALVMLLPFLYFLRQTLTRRWARHLMAAAMVAVVFSILGSHRELLVRAESIVEVRADDGETATTDAAACAQAPWEQQRDAFVYRKGAPGLREAAFADVRQQFRHFHAALAEFFEGKLSA